MDDLKEKIFQTLASNEKSLSASDIAEVIDGQSACDINRQRLDSIFQTLMKLVDEGRLDFDRNDPLCFCLR
jgi:hypothetical protein